MSHQTALLQGEMRHPETTNHADVKNPTLSDLISHSSEVEKLYNTEHRDNTKICG